MNMGGAWRVRRVLTVMVLIWGAPGGIRIAAAHSGIVLTDDQGYPVSFPEPPRRIVTMTPSLTETVCALGACSRIVGTDRYSNWPSGIRALPKVGGMQNASIERIAALRPDVVLVSGLSRAADRLRAMGIRVVALDLDTDARVHRAMLMVASMLGDRSRGVRLWKAIGERIQAASDRVPAMWRGRRVYFEVSAAPYAAGADSFIGVLLGRLGLVNVVPASLGPFPRINPEFVVRANPELIIASKSDAAGMAMRPGWSHIEALRSRRICAFAPRDYDVLIQPGPRLAKAAALIVHCLRHLRKAR